MSQLPMVVVSMGLFEGLLVGMSLGLLVLVIEGTGSEAMFYSSDWLSGWQGSPVHALLEVLLVVIGL